MSKVIIYADDDDVLNDGFENELFKKFKNDPDYTILPIASIENLTTIFKSVSNIQALLLDWQFKKIKEDEDFEDLPDKNETPLDFLKNQKIYSLIYIYSRESIEESIQKNLKELYGENKIRFNYKNNSKYSSEYIAEEFNKIKEDISKFETDNKHMEIPFIWGQSINQSMHTIFSELEKADPDWIKEIRDTAKNDGNEPTSEVINVFHNLLDEFIIQDKNLRNALDNYNCESTSISEENTAKLYQRIFYTQITNEAPIMTGDIFRFNDNEFGILITPECEIKSRKDSSLDFLTFKISNIDKFLQRAYSYDISKESFEQKSNKSKDKLRKIFNNDDLTIHLLPSFPFNNVNKCACIYFKESFTIKNKKEYDGRRITYKLNSPYIQQLRQRYVAFFGRYGVPAIPKSLRDFNLKS